MIIGIEAQRIFRRRKHGMDFAVLSLIRELQLIDKVNMYFIFVNEGPDRCLEETENFKIRSFSAPYILWEQVKLPAMARKLGCDILHLTSNTGPVRCKVPIILTLHDIIYYEQNLLLASGYTPYQRLGNIYRTLVVRRVVNKARKILTVSNFERKQIIKRLDVPAEKVSTVYNGVANHFLNGLDQEEIDRVLKRYSLPEKYILFLGNTDPKKNTSNTVVAFARFCEISSFKHKLVVADLPAAFIRNTLKAEGLEHHFHRFVSSGYIKNSDMPGLIAGADLFLYPSKRESFGIPILEGFGAGTPVITSNTSAMPEVGGPAVEYVDPEKPEELAQKINDLLHDQQRRGELRERGFERVQQFSWSTAAKQVLAIYQEVI